MDIEFLHRKKFRKEERIKQIIKQRVSWYLFMSGRRVEKNVDGYKTRYIYTETHASNRRDGGDVIAEYDGNGNLTRKYIHGAGVDEPVCMIDVADSSAVYYYRYDGLGSVVAIRTYPNNRLYCGRLQSPMPALSVQKCSQRGTNHASDHF